MAERINYRTGDNDNVNPLLQRASFTTEELNDKTGENTIETSRLTDQVTRLNDYFDRMESGTAVVVAEAGRWRKRRRRGGGAVVVVVVVVVEEEAESGSTTTASPIDALIPPRRRQAPATSQLSPGGLRLATRHWSPKLRRERGGPAQVPGRRLAPGGGRATVPAAAAGAPAAAAGGSGSGAASPGHAGAGAAEPQPAERAPRRHRLNRT